MNTPDLFLMDLVERAAEVAALVMIGRLPKATLDIYATAILELIDPSTEMIELHEDEERFIGWIFSLIAPRSCNWGRS